RTDSEWRAATSDEARNGARDRARAAGDQRDEDPPRCSQVSASPSGHQRSRLGSTTRTDHASGLWDTAEREGGRGVPGAGRYRAAVAHIEDHGSTGSPAEAELLIEMKRAGIPAPVPQYEIVTPSGRRYLVDFGWPDLDKGVE